MKERVLKIISQIFNVPVEEIPDAASFEDIPNWDSANHLNFIMAVEQEFGVRFSEEQIVEMLNIDLILLTLKEELDSDS